VNTDKCKQKGQTNKTPKQTAMESTIFVLLEDTNTVIPAEGSLV